MKYEQKGMGAILNPEDKRDIPIAFVQGPVALPREYKTDLSDFPVEDQMSNGSCVGQCEGKGIEYFDKEETGIFTRTSKRFIYGQCKKRDGHEGEGTYPRVAAKVMQKLGDCREELVEDDNSLPHSEYIKYDVTEAVTKDAYIRRVGGYAFVAQTAESIKQAIYQNGVVSATLEVGDWADLPVKPDPYRGRHRILLYGFEEDENDGDDDVKIFFRNSWGENWGDDGNGWFWWSDYKYDIHDIMAFVDIPNEMLEDRKKVLYVFTHDLERGDTGSVILELQKRLEQETALDGKPCFRGGQKAPIFGPLTEAAVKRYQCANNIICYGSPTTTGYGRVGPQTRASLNAKKKSDLPLYPRVEELRDQLVAIMDIVGEPIYITDEYRTFAEQDEIYAQGRTKPGEIVTNARGGESFHNWRCAFDIAFKSGSGITYEGPWELVGSVGEILGLEWGGRWEFEDNPHFQFTAGYDIEDFQKGNIDVKKFGTVGGTMTYKLNNINMSKRVKSFLISASSIFVTAMVAVVLTPEWTTLIQDVYGWLTEAGLPVSVVAVLGLLVAEVWKQVLNEIKIRKYEERFGSVGVERAKQDKLDLY